ncbi:MAG: hypothetical protein ACD_45C00685G0003 [uncultured bacterium]|nr:MAG: hypothetical protein ACD_45C00685G0003 [uncultured bacterium]
MTRTLWILLFCSFLSACSIFSNEKMTPEQQGLCNELKHRIIFNGATGNNTEATQQRAELGVLHRSYTSHGCN